MESANNLTSIDPEILARSPKLQLHVSQKAHSEQTLRQFVLGLAPYQTPPDEAIRPNILLGGSEYSEEEVPDASGYWINLGSKRMWMSPETLETCLAVVPASFSHMTPHSTNASANWYKTIQHEAQNPWLANKDDKGDSTSVNFLKSILTEKQ